MTPKDRLYEKAYAADLIHIATGDLASAKVLGKSKVGRPENTCFLAQQVVEKSLKAVLCWLQVPFPFTHDLGILIAKLPGLYLPPGGYQLTELSVFAAARRYEIGPWELESSDVVTALEVAEEVLAWARELCSGSGKNK